MEIIKTEQLVKTYADHGVPVHALRGINLSIERGEFIAIAGPSGSGKTTLLNCIGALDRPTTGRVCVNEQDIDLLDNSERARLRLHKMGFVFQAYNLIPVLTALENIEFKMMLLGKSEGERHELAMRSMKELGIADLAHKKPQDMSGGQQQRVAIARAIVNEPPIVLADEPTANLDTENALILIDLMRDMGRTKNVTFVFSTHDPRVLERVQRIIFLRDGNIADP